MLCHFYNAQGPGNPRPFFVFARNKQIEFSSPARRVLQYGMAQVLHKEQTILDVISNVTVDLRHNAEFCTLLTKLDEEAARNIAQAYIVWLNAMIEMEGIKKC